MTSNAVNRPTDPKLRDKNIDAKLQIYGIITAFGNGKVPSNQQIDVAMNTALAWQPLSNPPSSLSQDGRRLVADLRNVIEQAKILVLSKNEGNLLQDFVWQTRNVGQGNANGVNAPIDRNTANQHASQAAESLRTLGRLLITNGQFRKLLNDATILLRDMAGDAAEKSASKINPSEQQLNQIDEPEREHTWHDTPDFSKENLKQQAQSSMPVGKEQAKKTLGDATQAAHPSGTRDPVDAASRDMQQRDTSGVSPQQGAQQGVANVRDQVSANMSEEQKQRLREQRERAANYLDRKMPQERREQVIYRLKKMIVECQQHSEYQQAIDALLNLAEEYQGHSKDIAKQSSGAVQGGRNQSPVQLAEHDLKTILERFANGTSFDSLIDSIDQIYRDADQDPEFKKFFKDLDAFIRKCLKREGFILEDRATQEYNQLYERGDYYLRNKYKPHTDRVVDEFKYIGDQFDNDPQNNAFARSIEKLFKDLGQDEAGNNAAWKPHLLKDLQHVIIPGIFQNIGYIPVPRIEYSDPMIDAIVENLVLEGDNIMPNKLEFSSDNYWQWARSATREPSKNKNKVMLSVSGIQMDIQDVAYYVRKKEGFPSITDTGVCDIYFGGTGISFKVAMETADKSGDNAHFFKINSVTTDIQGMNIRLKQSNHKLLFNLVKPLLLRVMRPVVQRVVEKQVRDNVQKLDAMMFEAKKEADRAKESAKRSEDPEDVKSLYQYYYEAFQNQISRAQAKKEEVTGDKQANVAITQHDSIFKNIQLPGGTSTKATKYNDMARQGDKWQSPVFSIGSASESRGIQPVNVSSRGGNTNQFSSRGITNSSNQVSSTPVGSNPNKVGYLDPGRSAAVDSYGSQPNGIGRFGPEPNDGHTTLGKNNPLLPGAQFPGSQAQH